jgi:hypothetical protein
VITGAGDLSLSANARVDSTTEARMGAAIIGSGSAAVAPAIAVTLSTVTTSVLIHPTAIVSVIDVAGSFSAIATQRTSSMSSASAEATGGTKASVGIALALTLATAAVTSRTERSIVAGGSIALGSFGSSHNEASAEASASGAPGKADNDAETKPSSGGTVEDKLSTQRSFANTTSTANGGSGVKNTSANPSPASSDGKVSVAAAIGLVIADVSAITELPAGLSLTAGGAVSLHSSENVDGLSSADGSAVKAASAGIGVGVALTVVTLVNRANLGDNTVVTSNGFSAEATMTDVDGDTTHTFSAIAQSGAGSDDIGVAGSFAMNLVTASTEAFIPSAATVSAGNGDIALRAVNYRSDTATATADASLGKNGTAGIGAAVAINPILGNITRAEIEDGADVSGGHNATIEALSSDEVVTTVKAGSKGGTAISPAVAVVVVEHTTIARIGTAGPRPWETPKRPALKSLLARWFW